MDDYEFFKLKSLNDFAREDLRIFIARLMDPNAGTEEQDSALVGHFNAIDPHPAKSDLIFWPAEGADDSPEGIVTEIERYCRESGISGFKDSDF